MSKQTIEQTVKSFLKFEHDNNLFSLEIDGIRIWGFLRYWFHYVLSCENSGISVPMQGNKRNNFLINLIKAVWYSIKSTRIKKSDILYIDHPRRVKQEDGNYYCLYTDFIKKELEDDFSGITLEEPFWVEYIGSRTSHYTPVSYKNIFYTDLFDIKFIVKKSFIKLFKTKKYRETKKVLDYIFKKFNRFYGLEIKPENTLAFDWVLYLLVMFPGYTKLFDTINPKMIIEFRCSSMFRNIMTYIANERNIPVIEMQHGVYSIENMFYKFYLTGKYTPLPDYVFTLSKGFFDEHYLPFLVPKQHIIPAGYLFLEHKKKQYKRYKTKPKIKNILIVSQGSLNKEIRKFAVSLANKIKPSDNMHIVYKKHPYEKDATYNDLKHKNITVISDNKKDIYYYFSKAYCQVGVYSTAIYEGISFKLPTFILKNLYCADQTRKILGTDKGVFYISDADEVYEILRHKHIPITSRNLQNKLWHKADVSKIKQKIKEILRKKV